MHRNPREHGAAAVEFALLLPLLVVLAFGISEFGTAYNRSQAMQAAVREGARLASTGDVPISDITVRVHNALQEAAANQTAFPPSGSLGGVVDVELFKIASATDAGSPTTTGCDTGDFGVRVVASVNEAHRDEYGLNLIVLPEFPLSHRSEAIFRCVT